MDLKKLVAKKYTRLFEQNLDGSQLTVKETVDYRWFELAGNDVQSIMSRATPEQIITPVSQSLLLFLLWKSKPLKVLSLGLGGAAFERTLASIPSVLITSVEASQPIIDMAKQFFNLPKKVHVVCQKAEDYVQQTQTQIKFDVVICDLFYAEKSPEFLFSHEFYGNLKNISADASVMMINLQADTDEQLLKALLAMKKHFTYLALIEFDDYKNIVLICSNVEIPEREDLQKRLANFKGVSFTDLNKVIPKIRYIPPSKSP